LKFPGSVAIVTGRDIGTTDAVIDHIGEGLKGRHALSRCNEHAQRAERQSWVSY
jgi:hypothetical protein